MFCDGNVVERDRSTIAQINISVHWDSIIFDCFVLTDSGFSMFSYSVCLPKTDCTVSLRT